MTDVHCGKFVCLVQKTWDVMFIRKKAYILWQWYRLSSEQKRFYLDLKGHVDVLDFQIPDDDVPDFQIPNDDLKEIRNKPDPAFTVIIVMRLIDRAAYTHFDNLTKGIFVVLGSQNEYLAIGDRIMLETLAIEAAEQVDADAYASDKAVM